MNHLVKLLFLITILFNGILKANLIFVECLSPLSKFSTEGVVIKDVPPMEKLNLYIDLEGKEFALVPLENAIVKGQVISMSSDLLLLYLEGAQKYVYAYFFKNKTIVVVPTKSFQEVSLSRNFFSGQCNYTLSK